MNENFMAAAELLADTLARENTALAALDLPCAAAMLADKHRAVAGFLAARDAQHAGVQHAVLEPLAQRLMSLSEANRALLERAIAVQRQVIGIVARACAPGAAASGYSAQGTRDQHGRPTAFAVCARA